MIRPLAYAVILLAATHASAQTTLVWSDEFDGSSIDAANWEHMLGTGTAYGLPAGWGNNELQSYTSSAANSFVSGGSLHIVARREASGAYTSARLRTKNLQDFLYGRIEARIQLPSGQGIWPAFWMLPTTTPYGGWAASGEIDIMESVNTADTVYGTAHYGGEWPGQVSSGSNVNDGTDFAADFHVYAIEWDPDQIRWYLDGAPYFTLSSNQWWSENSGGNQRAPFDTAFHLLLNIAVGGDWPGPPNGGVGFPMEMIVDYVRVYQTPPPPQEPYFGTPQSIPGTIQAEDFDLGGEGVAYHDLDASNNGTAYRPSEGVDLEASTEGGFNVGWMREGEWTEYTVDVQTAGEYDVEARVASATTGGIFHLEFEGAAAPATSGTLVAPVTGGWQTWTTATTTVTLDVGEQVMRFVNDGAPTSAYNFNSLTFIAPPTTCPGDLDGDTDTDVFDFGIFASAFGTALGDPAFNPDADFDASNTIDVFDFGIFAPDFGCPN